MRKTVYIVLLSILLPTTFSCSDFMEFPPAADFNIDSVFSRYTNAEKLVYEMYDHPVPLNIDTRAFGSDKTRMNGGAFASALTDEGQSFHVQQGYHVQQYYIGNVDPAYSASWSTSSSFKGEDDYLEKWKTIRKAYILIENIDRVPDASIEQKVRIKGEAKLMIATVYFEMFKRYGGVPIVRKAYTGTEADSEINLPRATLEETYNFIWELLEDVIHNYEGYIPANYIENPNEFGRLPMAFAYALKARFLLYAASPLYNTDQPYSNGLGEQSNLICFMSKNPRRWEWAAEAATQAINYCNNHGYKLVDAADGRDNAMNYSVANIEYPSKGNTEVIWGISQAIGRFADYVAVRYFSGTAYGNACNLVPVNQIERYEIDSDTPGKYKNWDTSQSFNTGIVDSDSPDAAAKKLAAAAMKAYREPMLDPRFYASVIYNGDPDYGKWGPLGSVDMADAMADDGTKLTDKNGQLSEGKQKTTILHFVRKFHRGYEGRESALRPLNIYMRMAELYLIRAEALNESSTDYPVQQVYDDLNLIRTRSGMCNVKSDVSQSEMREIIAHERNIEMFYEDQRWFDLRRTLEAENKILVQIYKIAINKWYKTKNSKYPYKITYEKVPYQKRVWKNSWYMNPFPKSEKDKFYGLIQNPEW